MSLNCHSRIRDFSRKIRYFLNVGILFQNFGIFNLRVISLGISNLGIIYLGIKLCEIFLSKILILKFWTKESNQRKWDKNSISRL